MQRCCARCSRVQLVGSHICSPVAQAVPDFRVGPQLHHIITAEPVLSALFPVVGADGLAIQEGAVQTTSVCDLPAALTGIPLDHHMPARHLCVWKGQCVVL